MQTPMFSGQRAFIGHEATPTIDGFLVPHLSLKHYPTYVGDLKIIAAILDAPDVELVAMRA